MKKEIVLGFLVLMSFGFVVAGTCDDDQTIMRLYQSTNSHVSTWNQSTGTYLEEVCYNDIYGYDYVWADPHVCDGNNKVLTLYDETNSHASTILDQYYTEEICYGDLECVYDSSSGSSCSNDGEVVARLYNDYNSHVSYASDTDYGTKICCSSSRAYWADMNGVRINQAEFGDTVQLIYRGTSAQDLTIREEDVLADDEIRVISSEVKGELIIGTWKIIEGDLEKTADYDEFYFEVEGEKSSFLEVLLEGNDADLNVQIISPACGSYYDNDGSSIQISVSANDLDDVIEGEVKIDGEVVREFGNGNLSFDYVFASSGNAQVVVEAINSRGKQSRVISNIMILAKSGGAYVDGEYIAACITKPKDYSHIDGSVVDFDAAATRAIRITNGVLDVLIPGEDLFSWYWNFYPEDTVRIIENTKDPFAYIFTAGFPIPGDNSASLRVEI
ncbi:Ig-like domain-containing protein [Methanococcoides sp. SA1]|nr:Ig-like domain-containing protein [Methanococcoides sp. SA1]